MAGSQADERDVDVDLRQLFVGILRNLWLIGIVTLAVTAAALAVAWMAAPQYRAETRLLIELRESIFTRPGSMQGTDQPILDGEGVTSQVQVLTSTDLLRKVAADLDLAVHPEFEADARPSFLRRMMGLVGLGGPDTIPPEERVLRAVREKLTVYRVENSRVIVVEFSSEDPRLAAEVANAIAETYISVQRDAKQMSNADATAWLEPEIEELRQAVREAERRVADFRASSDLLVGQNNSILATQQLAELSTELSRVRANRAAADANAEGVRAAIAAGALLDSLPEVLGSGLIQRLREREVQLKADIADLSTTLLDNHPRIRALRSQLADLESQISVEARKLLTGLENEARNAQLRERQLAAELNTLKAESARAGDETVELRALEREAAAQRDLLETYLGRYREAASRGERNYAPVDARIFSRAIPPLEPYFPKPLPIAGAAFVGTLLLMVIGVLLAELFSGRAMRPARNGAGDNRVEPGAEQATPFAPPVPAAALSPADTDLPVKESPVPEFSADQVTGNFTDTNPIEGVDLGIEAAAERLITHGATRAIFFSPEGDEAAASAVLVARETSDAGLRTILVDLTLSGAASRPMLDGEPRPGITDLLAAKAQFGDVIHGDLYSACDLIPSGTADPELAMRAADRLPMILKSLSTAYDLIIIECGAAETEALSRLFEEGVEVMISTVGTTPDAIEAVKEELFAEGFGKVSVVSPLGYMPPETPMPGRSAA